MGRPPLNDGERRDGELRIRLTAQEREVIDEAAKTVHKVSSGRGISSTWARQVLLNEAKRMLKSRRS